MTNRMDILALLLYKIKDVHYLIRENFIATSIWVSWFGDINIAKYLAERGVDVNYRNINGITLIIEAIKRENYELVKYLIEKGKKVPELIL